MIEGNRELGDLMKNAYGADEYEFICTRHSVPTEGARITSPDEKEEGWFLVDTHMSGSVLVSVWMRKKKDGRRTSW